MHQRLFIALFLFGCTVDVSTPTRSDQVFHGPSLDQAIPPSLDLGLDEGRPVVPDAQTMVRDTGLIGDAQPDAQKQDASTPLGNPFLPRRANETCRLPEPPPIGNFVIEPAFPRLGFDRPLWFGVAPGDPETIFVAEQRGRIYAFDDREDVESGPLFLRINASRAGNEEGLLGLAFHPDYAENGRFFVYYSAATPQCEGLDRRCSIISEFTRSERRRADSNSERRLLVIPQPYSNHNGGDLKFGPDGLLYISVGDGGSANDPLGHGQNTDTLLGTILRIDVDSEQEAAYGIPPTNPFVNGGGRPEIYAWGLRNVWRMFFDPSTGALWAGDVGQVRKEEVNRITGPGNYGWRITEGDECFRSNNCDREGLIEPVHTYGRGAGESITGGFVYRGQRLPELWGKYIFADFDSRAVWALDADGTPPIESTLLTRQTQVSSFGEDARGNLYMTTFQGGRPIVRLRRAREPQNQAPFPQLLSQTGCFSDVSTHTVAPGVIPYRVNLPFWSDGLRKYRYAAFPDGTQATYQENGGFELPVGTVLIKTFEGVRTVPGPGPEGLISPQRIETRLFARFMSGWRGFTYLWKLSQDDATLLETSRIVAVHTSLTPEVEGSWYIPSRTDCDQCHTAAAGFTLGWSARQLNGQFVIDGVLTDQLQGLAEAGYVTIPADVAVPAHPRPPPIVDYNDPALMAGLARAYLDVNCAPCHQPQGGANSSMDLRSHIPLSETHACGIEPEQGDLGIEGARLIVPGAPEQSVLVQRMRRYGDEGMPPFRHALDLNGVNIVERWIESLEACPE